MQAYNLYSMDGHVYVWGEEMVENDMRVVIKARLQRELSLDSGHGGSY